MDGSEMKIGMYNKYLHTYGGGEKHSTAIAEVLSHDNDVELITHEIVEKSKLEKNLNFDLKNVNIRYLPWNFGPDDISEVSKEYDLFINASYMSYFPSYAKKNMMLIYFPTKISRPLHIYNAIKTCSIKEFIKAFKIKNHFDRSILRTYDIICANSRYTQNWIRNYWNVESEVLYPPVDMDFFRTFVKKNYILSVGRFFAGSHNKKHIPMIRAFKQLCDEGLRNWAYHLIGNTHTERIHQNYLKKVKSECEGYPVYIHNNIPFEELKNFYGESKIFWHATGFQEDENKHPERFEHFGITTVEAMTAGCVPVVIGNAGQLEIIEQGVSGFLWNDLDELKKFTLDIVDKEQMRKIISLNAIERSKMFSKEKLENRIGEILSKYQISVNQ